MAADVAQGHTYFLGLMRAGEQPAGYAVYAALAVLIAVEWLQRHQAHPLQMAAWPRTARWGVYMTLSAAILVEGTYNSTPFIYFQF
jgi:hypothetical protein